MQVNDTKFATKHKVHTDSEKLTHSDFLSELTTMR